MRSSIVGRVCDWGLVAWILLVVYGSMLTLALFWIWSLVPDRTIETFENIQVGMTESEVVEILGNHPREARSLYGFDGEARRTIKWREWENRAAMIRVGFGPDGRVQYKTYSSRRLVE